ncbi:MAG: EI24 domain-containing protein [Rhodospirillaceae bacterium]|nr:EI24 domain-containing protein [Rhodospirillaceae bacterium]MBL6941593.1 EI24 domain-containing protein [Rhodospirillales bacterium]
MISAFIKAAQQISDPRARRVIWFALAAAAGVFILLWVAIGFLLANTALFSIGWLETAIDWLGGLATGVLTWLLFPAAISAVIGLFLEEIASAVEARHYPDLGEAHGLNFRDTVLTTLRFLAIMLALNVLMLPLLLTGPLFPFVFYSVNGYLLGREYFELVALRRLEPAEATALRKNNGFKLFMTGALIAFLLTVPVVNLLAPIIATGMMVHLFEDFRNRV